MNNYVAIPRLWRNTYCIHSAFGINRCDSRLKLKTSKCHLLLICQISGINSMGRGNASVHNRCNSVAQIGRPHTCSAIKGRLSTIVRILAPLYLLNGPVIHRCYQLSHEVWIVLTKKSPFLILKMISCKMTKFHSSVKDGYLFDSFI